MQFARYGRLPPHERIFRRMQSVRPNLEPNGAKAAGRRWPPILWASVFRTPGLPDDANTAEAPAATDPDARWKAGILLAAIPVFAAVFAAIPVFAPFFAAIPVEALLPAVAKTRATVIIGAPTAVPMTATPAPAFAAIPAEIYASPACPWMPITAIPKEGAAVKPTIIMRPSNRYATDYDRAVVNGVAAIAFVVTGIGVARSRRVIPWPIIIGRGLYADMHTREANADTQLRARRLRNQHGSTGHRGGGHDQFRKRFHVRDSCEGFAITA